MSSSSSVSSPVESSEWVMADENEPKRRKVNVKEEGVEVEEDDQPWLRMIFHQSGSLKNMIDIIQSGLAVCCFEATCTDDFSGISFATVNGGETHLIMGRLECECFIREDYKDNTQLTQFFVTMDLLKKSLTNISPSMCVEILRYNVNEDPDIIVHGYDPELNQTDIEMKIQTIISDRKPVDMIAFETSYLVEIESTTMKSILSCISSTKGERIRFSIYQDKSMGHFVIDSQCEGMSLKQCFKSIPNIEEEDNGEKTVKLNAKNRYSAQESVVENGGNFMNMTKLRKKKCVHKNLQFQQEFCSDFLLTYIRCMEKHKLQMQMAEGLPLMITYSLGTEKSAMYFLFSPVYDDDSAMYGE